MARPRSFDPDEALDAARDTFWQKGFQGTSLDDITAATGLAKPSLYAAFGDKNALFLKVLDRYHARIVANAERILNEGPSARDAIERWLKGFVPFCWGIKGSRGCLSVNTAADGVSDQKEIRKRIERFNRKLEQLLRNRLHADRASREAGVASRSILPLTASLIRRRSASGSNASTGNWSSCCATGFMPTAHNFSIPSTLTLPPTRSWRSIWG